jgi:hypothetical protein
MRTVAGLIWAFLVAGCSLFPAPSVVAWGDRVPEAALEAEASQPVLGRGANTITLAPVSPRGAAIGTSYRYDMPHCGINARSMWTAASGPRSKCEPSGARVIRPSRGGSWSPPSPPSS